MCWPRARARGKRCDSHLDSFGVFAERASREVTREVHLPWLGALALFSLGPIPYGTAPGTAHGTSHAPRRFATADRHTTGSPQQVRKRLYAPTVG